MVLAVWIHLMNANGVCWVHFLIEPKRKRRDSIFNLRQERYIFVEVDGKGNQAPSGAIYSLKPRISGKKTDRGLEGAGALRAVVAFGAVTDVVREEQLALRASRLPRDAGEPALAGMNHGIPVSVNEKRGRKRADGVGENARTMI